MSYGFLNVWSRKRFHPKTQCSEVTSAPANFVQYDTLNPSPTSPSQMIPYLTARTLTTQAATLFKKLANVEDSSSDYLIYRNSEPLFHHKDVDAILAFERLH